MIPPPPRSTLFPYTTLFRSVLAQAPAQDVTVEAESERALVVLTGGLLLAGGVVGAAHLVHEDGVLRVFGEQRREVGDRRGHVRAVALVVAALDRLGQFGRHVGCHCCGSHAYENEDQLPDRGLARGRPGVDRAAPAADRRDHAHANLAYAGGRGAGGGVRTLRRRGVPADVRRSTRFPR